MPSELTALELLIKQLAALPGLGKRSARRTALHLLLNKDVALSPLLQSLQAASESIIECSVCGNLDQISPCSICVSVKRDDSLLCVVEGVADIWAVERTQSFKGHYHVLGGVLSPLEGRAPEDLQIDSLLRRIQQGGFTEVILAMGATVDGQTTAHYLVDEITQVNKVIQISRLAHGVPIGGELDFLDDGTISTALKSRARI
jgi:recombination protein RecR